MQFDFQQKMREWVVQYGAEYGLKILGALLVFVIGWWGIRLIVKLLTKGLNNSKIDISLHSFIRSIVNVALKILLIVLVATQLGANPTTFVAILSAAGIAVGLALKDSLGNLASGILILSFRYFRVGDFIEYGSNGLMGTVKEISLLYTILNTFDNKRVVVPNGELANGTVINYTAEDKRRVDLVFGIGYGDDFNHAKAVIHKVVNQHEKILKNPEPIIRVTEHGDSAILIAVKVWCSLDEYWNVYFDLHEEVKYAFDREGINIPFPQRDVHVIPQE